MNRDDVLKEVLKYVEKTLTNIPKNCCYTHDEQREPLEEIKKILEKEK